MTKEEIVEFIKSWAWGTLIGVEGDKPYAVEVSYGTDGEHIYCGSKPGGRMSKCLKGNDNVVFKICVSDRNALKFTAVTIEAKAERLTKHKDVLDALRRVASHTELEETTLDPIAERFAGSPEANFLKIPIKVVGGIIREGGKFTLEMP
jgi:nitroimidazol reductase NimA-like FMN-containing flavoprotein (pyridoxamine 5'-phosphate oxidase superfamily)